MVSFTVRLPRWPLLLRLQGRDPLVRSTDRIEALVLIVAVMMSLVAIPILAAVGTAIYDARRHVYAEQSLARSVVPATVTDVPVSQNLSRVGTTMVPARWNVAGVEYTGAVEATTTTKIDDTVEIWVHADGVQVPRPAPTSRAAMDAAMGALAIWISVAATAATVFTLTRAVCDRIRLNRWQHDFDSLIGQGDGRQYPGRTSDR